MFRFAFRRENKNQEKKGNAGIVLRVFIFGVWLMDWW